MYKFFVWWVIYDFIHDLKRCNLQFSTKRREVKHVCNPKCLFKKKTNNFFNLSEYLGYSKP